MQIVLSVHGVCCSDELCASKKGTKTDAKPVQVDLTDSPLHTSESGDVSLYISSNFARVAISCYVG